MSGNNEETITINRSELRSVLRVFAQELIKELGVKQKPIEPEWISKNQAVKICPDGLGRRKLDKAISMGYVRKKPGQQNNRYSAILVYRKDVESCIKNQNI